MDDLRETSSRRWLGLVAGITLAAVGSAALAHGTAEAHAREAAVAGGGEAATVALLDIEVRNQDGERLSFAKGVVGDKLVALTLFYGTCRTTCPVTNAIFAQVQRRLGERLEREVRLVSLSVDPARDTPRRLAALAHKHGARPGWVWVTGEKPAIDRVLDGLNAYTPDYSQHPIVVLVGDPRTGRWSRLFGFPDPDAILARLETLRSARADSGMTASVEEKSRRTR